jgi:hypothetical protein
MSSAIKKCRSAVASIGSRRVDWKAPAVSAETELWICEDGELAGLLPRAGEWDSFVEGVFEFDGGGWLLTVSAPEEVAVADVPPELGALVGGLRFRVELSVEPSSAPPEAWALAREVMERLGGALRGAGLDPESGHAVSWAS